MGKLLQPVGNVSQCVQGAQDCLGGLCLVVSDSFCLVNSLVNSLHVAFYIFRNVGHFTGRSGSIFDKLANFLRNHGKTLPCFADPGGFN